MAKRLENGSIYESADLDGDGIVTDEELDMQQRNMAWFALAGMLLYPFAVVLAVLAGLETGAEILGDMASVYFVSVAAIVAAFYGTQAYSAKNTPKPAPKKVKPDSAY